MTTTVELKILLRNPDRIPSNEESLFKIVENMDVIHINKILSDELECETQVANISKEELHLKIVNYDPEVTKRLGYLCDSGILWRLLKGYLRKTHVEICSPNITLHFHLMKSYEEKETAALHSIIHFKLLDETMHLRAMFVASLVDKVKILSDWFSRELECLVKVRVVAGEKQVVYLDLQKCKKDTANRLHYLCETGMVTKFLNDIIDDTKERIITKVFAKELNVMADKDAMLTTCQNHKTPQDEEYSGAAFSLMFHLFFPDHEWSYDPVYTEKDEFQYHDLLGRMPLNIPVVKESENCTVTILTGIVQCVELTGKALNLVAVTDDNNPGYCWLQKSDSPGEYFTLQDALRLVIADTTYPQRKKLFRSESVPIMSELLDATHDKLLAVYPFLVGNKISIALPWPKEVKDNFLDRVINKHWPHKDVIDKMVNEACHAIATKIMDESRNVWKLSFSSAGKHLARSFSSKIKKIFTTMNILLKEALGLEAETILETNLFWYSEESGENVISKLSLSEIWYQLLEKLLCFLANGQIPDYFMPTFNLLADIDEKTRSTWLVKTNYIRTYPTEFMNIFWMAHRMKDITGKLDWGQIFLEFLKRMQTVRSKDDMSKFLSYVYEETVKYHILNRNQMGIIQLCKLLDIGNHEDDLMTLITAYKRVLERLFEEKANGYTLSLVLSDCANLCHQVGIVQKNCDMINLARTLHEKAFQTENRHHSVDINFANFLYAEKMYKEGMAILFVYVISSKYAIHSQNPVTYAVVYSRFVDKVVCKTLGINTINGNEIIVPIDIIVKKLCHHLCSGL